MLNTVPHIKNIDRNNFFLIAGPCVIENKKTTFDIAEEIKSITDDLNIPFIFKASYKKANRSKIDSFTGIGDIKGLQILDAISNDLCVPTTTDVHSIEDVTLASQYVDILQIPAFLCRQTDLLIAAAKTKKIVSIKKGQFLSPEAMQFAIQKMDSTKNKNIMLIERGTTFGYQDLVVDYRSIPIMQKFNVPVILDCTHSLQQPNQSSGVTGGQPELIETIAKAGVAVGVDGLFIETHPKPSAAKSDGANMLPLNELKTLLTKLVKIRQAL